MGYRYFRQLKGPFYYKRQKSGAIPSSYTSIGVLIKNIRYHEWYIFKENTIYQSYLYI